MKVVRTRPAPNFTVSFKIFKSLCDLCVSQCTTISAPIRLATVFQQNQELEKCTRADTSHLSPLTSPSPLRERHKANLVFLMISGAPKTIRVTMSTAPVTICCSSGVTPARPRPF